MADAEHPPFFGTHYEMGMLFRNAIPPKSGVEAPQISGPIMFCVRKYATSLLQTYSSSPGTTLTRNTEHRTPHAEPHTKLKTSLLLFIASSSCNF